MYGFPGTHFRLIYNDEGEPIGHDYPGGPYYDDPDDDYYEDLGTFHISWADEDEEE